MHLNLSSSAQEKQMEVLSFTDGNNENGQQGDPPSDPVGCLYRDVLTKDRQNSPESSEEETSRTDPCQSADPQTGSSHLEETFVHQPDPQEQNKSASLLSESRSDGAQPEDDRPPHPAPQQININQPIRSLHGAVGAGSGSEGPLTITGSIETISDEEILKDREPEEGIRRIPRFQNYQPGKPSEVTAVLSLIGHKPTVPMETRSDVIRFF